MTNRLQFKCLEIGDASRRLVTDTTMKKQYVGHTNDFRKYALLRVLSDGDPIRIGVFLDARAA